MTRDEIENMPSGRAMDALIAEHVMGWTNPRRRHKGTLIMTPPADDPVRRGGQAAPHYSTDIADAWQVVEHLLGRAVWQIGVRRIESLGFWLCEVGGVYSRAENAPLAICRAALLAVVEDEVLNARAVLYDKGRDD